MSNAKPNAIPDNDIISNELATMTTEKNVHIEVLISGSLIFKISDQLIQGSRY